MKARFFALVALVLGMASCAKDFAPETQVGGEVDFRLSVAAPELVVTRAGENGLDDGIKGYDSAYGAIDYFQGDWSKMDLRYSLEVYDKTNKATYANVTPIKDRMVKILDKYEPVEFDLRLVPGRDYHFVVFADFVPEGTYLENAENSSISFNNWLGYGHYIGATLADIQNNQWDDRVNGFRDQINKEECDAYYATIDVEKLSNTSASSVVLRRPYAKLRVIATDLAELNLNVDPGKIEVVYEAGHNYRFNAVTGLFSGSAYNNVKTYEYEYDKSVGKKSLANHYYTDGYDAKTTTNANNEVRHTHMTLFTDYILTGSEQTAIHFTINVFDKKGDLIKSTPFYTDIPVQRNFLTTVIGNVLTTATEVEVSIDDNFASDINGNSQERILLETLINGGVYDLTSDLTITAPTHLTGDAVIRLNGYTLTYDIPTDKENAKDFAIMTRVEDGASLTFVGEGSVVSEGYIASANEGGVINVSEGTFISESCTVFQSNGGVINITGGEFQAAPYNGDYRYTINFIDAKADTGRINISGGRFYMYNPERSNSENPEMNFVVDGYCAFQDEDWFEVVSCVVVYNADEFKAAAKNPEYKAMRFGADINFGTAQPSVSTNKVILGDSYKLIAGGVKGTTKTNNYGLVVSGQIKVVIFDVNMGNGGGGIAVSNGANVEVNNLTIKADYKDSSRHVFYVGNATLTVNSGTFEALRTSSRYFSLQGADARVYVKGGTFEDMLQEDKTGPIMFKDSSRKNVVITGGKFRVSTPNYAFNPDEWVDTANYNIERVGDYKVVSAK